MKPIKLDEYIDLIRKSCIDMVDAALKQPALSAKFNLSVDLKDVLPEYTSKAELIFSATAFAKLISMVMYDNREVAVHGSVVRCEALAPENTGFFVDDVYLYPQEATSATVEASDAYGYWIARLPENTFNCLRFQAHSHVNMGVTPSSVDENFYHKLMVEVGDFYIFLIVNKRLDMWCEIYDIENNVLYETADVSTWVIYSDIPDDNSVTFNKTLKELVVTRVWTPAAVAPEEKKIATVPAPPTKSPTKKTTTHNIKQPTAIKKSKPKLTAADRAFINRMENECVHPTAAQIQRYMLLQGYEV